MIVTIGIPTYNQSKLINGAVASCEMQTYNALKIVIADDCSTDDTQLLMEKETTGTRISYRRNPINAGRIGNYRKLLYEYAVNTDWYVNLDGDDYLTDREFISYALKLVQSRKENHIVFFQGNHNQNTLDKVFPDAVKLDDFSYLIKGEDYFLRFYRVRKFTHLATLYQAPLARKIGFYNYDCLSADFHSLSRLSLEGDVILSSKNVGTWLEHEQNASSTLNRKSLQKELGSLDDIANSVRNNFEKKIINGWQKKMRNYYYQRLFYQMSKGQFKLEYLLFALRHFQFEYLYFVCIGRLISKLFGIQVK